MPCQLMSQSNNEVNSARKNKCSSHTTAKAKDATAAEPLYPPPPYTMKEIHDAIPLHCFQRKTWVSLLYIIRDFTFVAILASLATHIPDLLHNSAEHFAWAIYGFCQGLIFTGLWELAHECGHQALSPSKLFSNTAGLIIHSFLLVPYHSWRFTHAQHHKATNNIERDIAFVPDTKEVWLAAREARSPKAVFRCWDLIEDMPIVNLTILIVHQLVAWPIYLIVNNFALARMRAYPWWKRSHFYLGGDGPNFKPSNGNDIFLSTLGVATMAICLGAAASHFGITTVFLFYGVPWLWTNHWILAITFLQHTDICLPYYSSKTWSFLKGCASTIDRDSGAIGQYLFHGAIEYHVLHHHACRIPFYHAAEATKAIRRVMGPHYKSDVKTPFLWAFWKNYNICRFVEEKDIGSDVYFFGVE